MATEEGVFLNEKATDLVLKLGATVLAVGARGHLVSVEGGGGRRRMDTSYARKSVRSAPPEIAP